jgi:hypothetical protein
METSAVSHHKPATPRLSTRYFRLSLSGKSNPSNASRGMLTITQPYLQQVFEPKPTAILRNVWTDHQRQLPAGVSIWLVLDTLRNRSLRFKKALQFERKGYRFPLNSWRHSSSNESSATSGCPGARGKDGCCRSFTVCKQDRPPGE